MELTPIQWEFFEHHRIERHHYSQAVMLQNPERWNETWLRSAVDKLTMHHDALRITFDEREKEPVAYNRGTAEGEHFTLKATIFHMLTSLRKKSRSSLTRYKAVLICVTARLYVWL